MSEKIASVAGKVIAICFYLLFFLVPLAVTPFNFELFEYNKMMLTYALTVISVGSWLLKMICERKIIIRRTPFDLPLLLFLLSLSLSTLFSIDPHVSLWGYYSRFNGGLISIVSYILLYYAFITNIKKENIKRYLIVALISGLFVSIYGILERLGIDKHIWVQDVQNRVFSTLGQPNWLAAYLAILLPITIGFTISKIKDKRSNIQSKYQKYFIFIFYFLSLIFYICLLFTKSRSGFIGFWFANTAFWLLLIYKFKSKIIRFFLIFNFSLLIFNFIFATPFENINRFTFPSLFSTKKETKPTTKNLQPATILETGITESGDIRRIVWKGAIDITRNYPLFGTGPETFAYAYYKFRPREHNMTSEWDFLYNKAHNEYLNYAATTGIIGLGTYLLFIGKVLFWNLKKFTKGIINPELGLRNKKSEVNIDYSLFIIHYSLFSAWLSIIITNFLGFSVVAVQIFFFLTPAILAILSDQNIKNISLNIPKVFPQRIGIAGISLLSLYLLSRIFFSYVADYYYARGYQASRANQYIESYEYIKRAIELNPNEILYYDELSIPAAILSTAAFAQNEATLGAQLETQAVAASNFALSKAPQNVSFYKTRTRVFYELATKNPAYLKEAVKALVIAQNLAPTDPKIAYNLGLMYGKDDDSMKAIEYLKKSACLKPNYRESYIALALYYKEVGNIAEAKKSARFILDYINPGDQEAQTILTEFSK